jgi:tetratricopeptide (TPR) repeat protein
VTANINTTNDVERSALIHREIVRLAALIAIAVAGFLATRAVAAGSRNIHLHDAEEWYRRGQQHLAAHEIDAAVDALRRATIRNRTDKRYGLSLAQALAANHDEAAARTTLMTLRESAPEDPDVNLALARLAAQRNDVTEAVRFYRTALYAGTAPNSPDPARSVRFELVRFLLAHNESARAASELLAARGDLPEDASVYVEAARLFAQAGDDAHALEHFQRALTIAPDNGPALAGAATTAFQLGNYSLARTYLRRAPNDLAGVADAREIVELMFAHDPLAARIGSAERRRRVVADLTYAQTRLAACRSDATADSPEAATFRRDVDAAQKDIRRPGPLDQDVVERDMDLVERVAAYVMHACGPSTAIDRALLQLGRRHGGDGR